MKKMLAQMLMILGMAISVNFAGEVKSIGSAKEFDDLVNAGKPVIADFFATWCGPCKMLAPTIDDLAKTYGDKVTFVRVDVDQVGELATRLQIQSIPDVRVFNGGKQQDQFIGFQDKSVYEKALEKVTK